MKSMFRAATAAALLAGASSLVVAAPVAAQKKKQEEQKSGLKLTPDVQKAALAAQTALQAKDTATADPAIAQAAAAAKTDDDKYIVAALQLSSAQTKLLAKPNPTSADEQMLIPALDGLIANPRTPPADLPKMVFQRGVIAVNAKDPQAAQYFQRAQQLGYNDPKLGLQIVKLKMDSGDVAGASADLEKAIDAQTAAGQKADEELYRYAIAKTNQKRMGPQTMSWLKRYVAAYPTSKNWRDAIVTYGLQQQGVATLDKGQKVDLYRLMRASKSMADQYDYEIYAQWAFDLGLPYETKAVIAEGKAAGKVPASASTDGLLKAANASIASEGSLTPLVAKSKAAANGKLAAGSGDAFLGSGNYQQAAELYRVALEKGQVDADTVNTRLGIALANAGDKAGAKAAFANVKGAPRADVASLWTTWVDVGSTPGGAAPAPAAATASTTGN